MPEARLLRVDECVFFFLCVTIDVSTAVERKVEGMEGKNRSAQRVEPS